MATGECTRPVPLREGSRYSIVSSCAGTSLERIRQIIGINLPLGLIVVIIGASGRLWGLLSVQ